MEGSVASLHLLQEKQLQHKIIFKNALKKMTKQYDNLKMSRRHIGARTDRNTKQNNYL